MTSHPFAFSHSLHTSHAIRSVRHNLQFLSTNPRPIAATLYTTTRRPRRATPPRAAAAHPTHPQSDPVAPHVPVLVSEILHHVPSPIHDVVDLTLGAGGHALALLRHFPTIRRYIGIDKDPSAIALAQTRLHSFKHLLTIHHADFSNLPNIPLAPTNSPSTDSASIDGIHAIADFVLLDAGCSSMQIDDPARGFSFSNDGPLDMRMDNATLDTPTAASIVNSATEQQLVDMLYHFGDEPAARRIARAIVDARLVAPIARTKQLADLVLRAKGGWRKKGIHPATQTFQAVRMVVNAELQALDMGLRHAVNLLRPGGVIAVISFHSGEDRIVKRAFKQLESQDGGLSVVTRKPVMASSEEVDRNVRSRSAKLRVGTRLAQGQVGKRVKVNKYARSRED